MVLRKTVEIKAMSINAAWQGRRFKTPEYKCFEDEMLRLLKNIGCVHGWVVIEYHFYIDSFKKSDVGNFEKPMSDILVKAGAIDDDRFIKKIIMEKYPSKRNYLDIVIKPYEDSSGYISSSFS